MIEAGFAYSDLQHCANWKAGDTRCYRSFARAFESSHIFSCTNIADGNFIFSVSDVSQDMADDICKDEFFINDEAGANHEGISIIISISEGKCFLSARRSSKGGCPIYIGCGSDRVVLTWKFEDAVAVVDKVIPDIEMCNLYLSQGPALVRRMIFKDIYMLWPGETVSLSCKEDIYFTKVAAPPVSLESSIKENARLTDSFTRILQNIMTPYLEGSSIPLVEFSGGTDSSCIAIAASAVRAEPLSYGVIHGGHIGIQQKLRRNELIALLGLRDFESPIDKFLPFASLDTEDLQYTPYDETFRAASGWALDNHPNGSPDLAFTGIGGDETLMPYTFRHAAWELPDNISSSTLTGTFCRADTFLRRGIWAVHPFADARAIEFCRALPESIRKKQALHHLLLARRGLSDGFIYPRFAEHFTRALQLECMMIDFDDELSGSVLYDLQICDLTPLIKKANRAVSDGFSNELITRLYFSMKLDRLIRKYV